MIHDPVMHCKIYSGYYFFQSSTFSDITTKQLSIFTALWLLEPSISILNDMDFDTPELLENSFNTCLDIGFNIDSIFYWLLSEVELYKPSVPGILI